MSDQEKLLLELVFEVNRFEVKCRRAGKDVDPIPQTVFDLLGKLRDQLGQWGCNALARSREK